MSSVYSTVDYKKFLEDVKESAFSGTIVAKENDAKKMFLIRPYVELKGQKSGYFLRKNDSENGGQKKGYFRQFIDNQKKKYVRSETGIANINLNLIVNLQTKSFELSRPKK